MDGSTARLQTELCSRPPDVVRIGRGGVSCVLRCPELQGTFIEHVPIPGGVSVVFWLLDQTRGERSAVKDGCRGSVRRGLVSQSATRAAQAFVLMDHRYRRGVSGEEPEFGSRLDDEMGDVEAGDGTDGQDATDDTVANLLLGLQVDDSGER